MVSPGSNGAGISNGDLSFVLFAAEGDETVANEAGSVGVTEYFTKTNGTGHVTEHRGREALTDLTDRKRARPPTQRVFPHGLAGRTGEELAAGLEVSVPAFHEYLRATRDGKGLAPALETHREDR